MGEGLADTPDLNPDPGALMASLFAGSYYSSRDAARTPVEVMVAGALRLHLPDGQVAEWPYSEVRFAARPDPGDPVRLEHTVFGQETPETLVVPSAGFLDALRTAAPAARHLHANAGQPFAIKLAIAAAVTLLVFALALYLVLPRFIDWVAGRVPVQWEVELGKQIFQQIASAPAECTGDAVREIERILARLEPPGFESPYRFHVAILKVPDVNAFALPGGYLAIFSGLLEKSKSPEELAGVLAHEMEHVIQRHSTRAAIRDLSLTAILALSIGDLGGGLETARTFGQLHFQRRDEEAADQRGMERMIAARIDPRGMIRAFRTLETEGDEMPQMAKYLSTHPPIKDRIHRLERAMAHWRGPADPVLPGVEWRRIARACSSR